MGFHYEVSGVDAEFQCSFKLPSALIELLAQRDLPLPGIPEDAGGEPADEAPLSPDQMDALKQQIEALNSELQKLQHVGPVDPEKKPTPEDFEQVMQNIMHLAEEHGLDLDDSDDDFWGHPFPTTAGALRAEIESALSGIGEDANPLDTQDFQQLSAALANLPPDCAVEVRIG